MASALHALNTSGSKYNTDCQSINFEAMNSATWSLQSARRALGDVLSQKIEGKDKWQPKKTAYAALFGGLFLGEFPCLAFPLTGFHGKCICLVTFLVRYFLYPWSCETFACLYCSSVG